MNQLKCLLSVVIAAVVITTGSSLKCYNCVSTSDKECLDPREYSNFKPLVCNPELLLYLSKQDNEYVQSFGTTIRDDIDKNINLVCQKIVHTENNETIIIRSCKIKGTDNSDSCKAIIDSEPNGTISHCSVCEGDGCNSGHWMSPLSLSAILMSAIAVALYPLLFL